MLRSVIRYFFLILMHSAGHLHQSSTKLVIAPCRLKWINQSHGDQNFLFNTFIVVERQIKIFILQNALELTAVFVLKLLRNYRRVEDLVCFVPRHRQIYGFICDFPPRITDLLSAACHFLMPRPFCTYSNLSFFISYPQAIF